MLGNYIDLIIVFYVLFYVLIGIKRNPLSVLAQLLSLVVALPLAFATYRFSAAFFENNFQIANAYANILGFFINTLIIKLILAVSLNRVFKKIKLPQLENNFTRRSLNVLFSTIYGFLMIFIMFSSFVSLSLPAIMNENLKNSRFGQFVQKDYFRTNDDFRAIFGGVLKQALNDFSFMTVKTGPTEKVDLGFKALETTIDSQAEEKMLEMVNQERTSRGLKTLKMDEEARRAARDYGIYLFRNGIFSHTDLEGRSPSDRLKNYKIEYMMTGENLAYAPTLEEAHVGLMNSKGHRENILQPFFGRVGIGVIDGGEYGMIFVQEFLD